MTAEEDEMKELTEQHFENDNFDGWEVSKKAAAESTLKLVETLIAKMRKIGERKPKKP